MLHPHTELRRVNDEIGYGVFATRDIPRGTVTWVLDPLDQVMDPEPGPEMAGDFGEAFLDWTWVNGQGRRILCWDFGRFVNHSCSANSHGPGSFEFEVAVRDIAAGEEITTDYGTLNLEAPMDCRCGSPACRRTVQATDLIDIAMACDQQIRQAMTRVYEVPQPLWRWMSDFEADVARWYERPDEIPSVLLHAWPPMSPGEASGRSRSIGPLATPSGNSHASWKSSR
jgi:hypothetical protein